MWIVEVYIQSNMYFFSHDILYKLSNTKLFIHFFK